jgi:hypothetical protein
VAGLFSTRGRALGIALAFSLPLAGCGAQSPLSPDPVSAAAVAGPLGAVAPVAPSAPSAPAVAAGSPAVKTKAKARFTFRFDMLKGALSLVFPDGSALFGTYRGVATNPSAGQPRATLEGEFTGGTGIFAGATGRFSGEGTGGFAGDGEFAVALRGDVARAGSRKPFDLRVTLKGTVASTCTTEAPPRLFLDGTGAAKGLGLAVGHLEHDLGTQACAIIVID